MKILIILFSLFFNISDWDNNLQSAKETAHTENKLILLNFSGSDWCAPCIMLKKQVFTDSEFHEFASKKLVLMRADFPRLKKNALDSAELKKNEALAEKYNPQGNFPFTVLLDADGNVLKSWNGYNGKKDEILAEIKIAAND
jgi:thioredoxin-related protein